MKKWLIGIGISVLVVVAGAFFTYQYIMGQVYGSAADEDIPMTIEAGEPLKQVLDDLEKAGLVGNAQFRYIYMRFNQPDYTYQAGEYLIEKGTTLEEALEKFALGDIVPEEGVRVTIPEGWNVKQIVSRLADRGLGKEETYLELLQDPEFYEAQRQTFSFLPKMQKEMKMPLEGYLFPETYQLSEDGTEEEIIIRLLSQTEKVINQLAETYPKIKEDTHHVFTLASIVERETVLPEERSIVAGVFTNRIQDDWDLESCATVQYVLGKQRDRIMYEDLEVQDPYNTYLNDGLPPGPIAAPGRSSLEAVLNPAQHDYFFFVTKKDGSQGHHFAETYAEHKANDANSRGSW